MKNLYPFFFLFLVQPVKSLAQASKTKEVVPVANIQYTSENKAIGLNHIITDSLTYTELLHCTTITIENPEIKEIKFYSIGYFLPTPSGELDMVSEGCYSENISEKLIQKIVLSGVDKILIENVTGTDGKEEFKLGHRWFYLK